jgi:hypothetical protein
MTNMLFALAAVLAPVALALVVAEECRLRRWLRARREELREMYGESKK